MKKFLFVTCMLFVLALMAVAGVYWYISVYLSTTVSLPALPEALTPARTETTRTESETETMAAEEGSETDVTTAPRFMIPAAGIPLSSLPLTDAQKNAITAVGIEVETFTLTQSMLECGSEKIGIDRIEAMVGGGAPTFLEVTKLLPCLGAE